MTVVWVMIAYYGISRAPDATYLDYAYETRTACEQHRMAIRDPGVTIECQRLAIISAK